MDFSTPKARTPVFPAEPLLGTPSSTWVFSPSVVTVAYDGLPPPYVHLGHDVSVGVRADLLACYYGEDRGTSRRLLCCFDSTTTQLGEFEAATEKSVGV